MSNVGRAFAMAAERGKKDSGKWWQKALVYAAAPQIVGLGVEAVKEGGKALFLGQNSKDLFQTARGQDLLTDINAINNLKKTRANQEKAMTRDGGTISDWAYNDQTKKLRDSLRQRPQLAGATVDEIDILYNEILNREKESFRENANKFQTDWYADTDKYQNIPTRKEALANIESGTGFYSKSGIGRFGTMMRHRFDKKDIELEKNLSLMEAFYGPDYKNRTVEEFKKTLEGYDEDINELRTGYYGSYDTSTQGINRVLDKAVQDPNSTYTEVIANVQKQRLVERQVKQYINNLPNTNPSKALEAFIGTDGDKLPAIVANMVSPEELKSGQLNIADKINTAYVDKVLGPKAAVFRTDGKNMFVLNPKSTRALNHLDKVLFQEFGGNFENMADLTSKIYDKGVVKNQEAKDRFDLIDKKRELFLDTYAKEFSTHFINAAYETKLSNEVSRLSSAGQGKLFQEYMQYRINNTEQDLTGKSRSYETGLEFLMNRLGTPNASNYYNKTANATDEQLGRKLTDAANGTTTAGLEADAFGKNFNPIKAEAIIKQRIKDKNITDPVELESIIKTEMTDILENELNKAKQQGFGRRSEDALHGDVKNRLNDLETNLRRTYGLSTLDREDTVIGSYEEELGILLNPYKTVQKAVREKDAKTLARFLNSNDAQLAAFTKTEMQNLGLNPKNFRE